MPPPPQKKTTLQKKFKTSENKCNLDYLKVIVKLCYYRVSEGVEGSVENNNKMLKFLV